MHSLTTRNDFLRLRAQGLSLASIGRRLGVSKPTLIAWGRQSKAEIDSLLRHDQQHLNEQLAHSAAAEVADLTRKLNVLKQELFSRAFRDVPTPHLETLSGQLRQRLEDITSAFQHDKSDEDLEPNRTQ